MVPTPGFHHLHLNAVDPDAAIDFYIRQFPTSVKTRWGGLPAVKARTNVLILFTKVATAPATSPQTAIWHFGWHVNRLARPPRRVPGAVRRRVVATLHRRRRQHGPQMSRPLSAW